MHSVRGVLLAFALVAVAPAAYRAIDSLRTSPAQAAPATSSTTTSTTTTTLPAWPPPCGDATIDGRLTATDALYVLKAAVGLQTCLACLCDADGDGTILATDALRVLKRAVGLPAPVACPVCDPAVCGDGVVNRAGEQCDGSDDAACPGLCQADCTCLMPSCGDGVVNQPSETCDGTDDESCPTLCRADCTCPPPECGNGVREQGEVCDGSDTGEATCSSLGFGGGTLACAGDCSGYDTSACALPDALPPDPASIAPPLPPRESTDVKSATRFLYEGSSRVQYGVVAETIDERRAALVHGRVLDRDGTPLAGVRVGVRWHPELGSTQTRSDGGYDLVVNGGGVLVLDYTKAGYLPGQRRIDVAWQDTAVVDDLRLVPLDQTAVSVDLSGQSVEWQTARGSVVEDARGRRQSTLLVPAGAAAEMVLPDGSRRPLSTATIRQTEYTVGDSGPKAMPGELPTGVAYTYAVELSVDEALAEGAEGVEFTAPVAYYVDNFIGFPPGEPVPLYRYDRGKAAWLREADGRVIEIVGTTPGGLAELDTDGDGAADDAAALAALGITDAERSQLASLYAAGDTLWRVQLRHFSPIDCNWPVDLPPDATPPDVDPPRRRNDDTRLNHDCRQQGSIVECLGQVLGEEVPIAGTPYALVYRSSRVPGYEDSWAIEVTITDDKPPLSLLGATVFIEVAGRRFSKQFPPDPNQSYRFVWDGKDAFGRTVHGRVPAEVELAYFYQGDYACGLGCPSRLPLQPPPMPRIVGWRVWLGQAPPSDLGIEGWGIREVHRFGPAERTLYLGDGRERAGTSLLKSLETFMDYPAYPELLASAPDGSLYAQVPPGSVDHVQPDGTIERVVGGSSASRSCPDQPVAATDVDLRLVRKMAVAPDGSVFIAVQTCHRVYRLTPEAILVPFAGTGEPPSPRDECTDGLPPDEIPLYEPQYVALGPDGRVYFGNSYCLWTAAPGGRATVLTAAEVVEPYHPYPGGYLQDIAVGPDGTAYVVADTVGYYAGYYTTLSYIVELSPDGIPSKFAGSYRWRDEPEEGQPAVDQPLPMVADIDTDDRGNVFVTGFRGVFEIDHEGIVRKIVRPELADFPNIELRNLAVTPDGHYYLVEKGYPRHRIAWLRSPFRGIGLDKYAVAGDDGFLLHEFTGSGRHERSIDPFTGATLLRLEYDDGGALAALVDRAGNRTTIERGMGGRPTAVVSPFGDRTVLEVDGSGRLTAITNPAGETQRFVYSASGLLVERTDAAGEVSAYTYDATGNLVAYTSPPAAEATLARADTPDSSEVTFTNSEGVATVYRIDFAPDGGTRIEAGRPAGPTSSVVEGPDGIVVETRADGTVVTRTLAADPQFGMQAPYTEQESTSTPGGLTRREVVSRTRETDAAFHLAHWEEDRRVNDGPSAVRSYDAATRTWTSTTAAGRAGQVVLDERGLPTDLRPAGLAALHLDYDGRGRLSSMTWGEGTRARTVDIVHQGAWPSALTGPLGGTTTFSYDAAGRVVSTVLPDGAAVSYERDARGNVSALVTPLGGRYGLLKSPRGNLLRLELPDVGDGSDAFVYERDGEDRLARVQRPDGRAMTFEYDGAGQLARIAGGASGGDLTFAYDGATGRLATAATPDVTTTFSHDGFLLTETAWSGAVSGTIQLDYDDTMRVHALAISGSSPLTFAYDADGLMTAAGDLTLTRDPDSGLLVGETLGQIDEQITRNGFGEPTERRITFAGQEVADFLYERDARGRIVRKVETIEGASHTFEYSYDAAGHLVEVRRDGSLDEQASYDADGNRTAYGSARGTVTAAYDLRDRLLSQGDSTYSYAPSGERIAKTTPAGTTTYEYDAMGRLHRVDLPDGRRIDYVVDALGRRVVKQVDGQAVQRLLYLDGLRPVAELDDQGNVVTRFVYEQGSHVPAYMEKGGKRYRLIRDPVGSVRLVIDADSGAIAQRIDYDAFGRVITDTNPGFQPFGFAGGLYDVDTGLVHFAERDYDPEAARWLTLDPLAFGDVRGNPYVYVGGDPVNRVDPWGLAPDCPDDGRNQRHDRRNRRRRDPLDEFLRRFEQTNEVLFGAMEETISGAIAKIGLRSLASGAVQTSLGGATITDAVAAGISEGVGSGLAVGAGAAVTTAIGAAAVTAALEAGIIIGSAIGAITGL